MFQVHLESFFDSSSRWHEAGFYWTTMLKEGNVIGFSDLGARDAGFVQIS